MPTVVVQGASEGDDGVEVGEGAVRADPVRPQLAVDLQEVSADFVDGRPQRYGLLDDDENVSGKRTEGRGSNVGRLAWVISVHAPSCGEQAESAQKQKNYRKQSQVTQQIQVIEYNGAEV